MTAAPGTSAERVERAARSIADRLGAVPEVAIVLGSGLGHLAQRLERPRRAPYSEIAGFPATTIVGHQGELVAGTLGGTPVLVQSGRFHLYEGHSAETVVLPVRAMATLGVRTLILTNAAGGIRRTFSRGALMMIADHVNLTFRNPLIGPLLPGEERFPDMSDPYDGLAAVAGSRGGAGAADPARGGGLSPGAWAELRDAGGGADGGADRRGRGGDVHRRRGDRRAGERCALSRPSRRSRIRPPASRASG